MTFTKEKYKWKNYKMLASHFGREMCSIYVSSAGRINKGIIGELYLILNLLRYFELAKVPNGEYDFKFEEAEYLWSVNSIIFNFERNYIIPRSKLIMAKKALGFCDTVWDTCFSQLPEDTPITLAMLENIARKEGVVVQYNRLLTYLGFPEVEIDNVE